ncbi:MAG: hypothetical protein OEY30_03410, partial [Candidatus Bathyarchaeota archaeon]|nr:hypothetical protein [Candidatus Bathyarchaeota archaeon]
ANNWDGWDLGNITWAVLVIIVALIITLTVIITRRDVAYSLVIVWALVGIIVQQVENQSVVMTAGTSVAIILVALPVFSLRAKRKE